MKRRQLAVTWVAWIALGVLAGIALYYLSVFVLFVVGFSFYAVTAGLFLAFALWLIGTPLLYVRLKKRGPQFMQRFVPFLIGMMAFLAVGCLEVAITTPHTIVPR